LPIHENVPDEFEAFVVNVLPVVGGVLISVKEVIASPSGSAAVIVTVPGTLGENTAEAGAVTTGARSVPTVTVVAAEPESVFDAVTVTV
jgi:hypothetical protein